VGRRGVRQPAPVTQRPGDHLRAVVHAQVGRRPAVEHEDFEDVDELIGVARAAHPDGETLTGELVDDVGHLQPALIGGLIELEVDGPDVVRPLCAEPVGERWSQPPALAAKLGPSQALVPPQALDALAVDVPALSTNDRVGGLPAPPRMALGDLAEAGAELGFGIGTRTRGTTLGRPVLAEEPTGTALGHPEAFDEHHHRPPATLRGHHFPDANSFNIALSSSASASSFLRRAFSFSSSLRRLASSAFMPPYWLRQRFQVDSAMARWRRTSARSLPALSMRSPSRSLRTTCSGVWRCRFTVVILPSLGLDSHSRWTAIRGPRQWHYQRAGFQ